MSRTKRTPSNPILKIRCFRAPQGYPTKARVVDLRTLFNQLGRTGRFRDWIRRIVVPQISMDEVHNYEPTKLFWCGWVPDGVENRERAYFIKTCLISQIIDVPYELQMVPVANSEDELQVLKGVETSRGKVKADAKIVHPVSSHIDTFKAALSRSTKPKAKVKAKPKPKPKPKPKAKVKTKKGTTQDVWGISALVGKRPCVVLKIPAQGYSNNSMYTQDTDGRVVCTRGYNQWKSMVHNLLIPEIYRVSGTLSNVDFTKRMVVHMDMCHMPQFDTNNLTKSTIDAVATAIGFNDKLVKAHAIVGTDVKAWKESFTTITIMNL